MRWGALKDLVEVSGLSTRTLQYIRKQEPNVLVFREKKGGSEYDLGACNTNLRARERALALKQAEPKDFEEARSRKMAAEARLAELELAAAEGKYVPVEEAAKSVERMLAGLRGNLLGFPNRYAPVLAGCKGIPEISRKLEAAIEEAMGVLSGGGE